MKKFDTVVENYFKVVLEQDAPAAPVPDMGAAPGGGSALPGMGGGAPGGMDMMGGEQPGQEGQSGQGDMDNEAKRETDPREYTRSEQS